MQIDGASLPGDGGTRCEEQSRTGFRKLTPSASNAGEPTGGGYLATEFSINVLAVPDSDDDDDDVVILEAEEDSVDSDSCAEGSIINFFNV